MANRLTSESLDELIDGRYRLIRKVGEGGMGRVYEAEHVGIGKHVALKILHAMFANITDAVERFRSEARVTSRINNAHIIDVTDSGMTDDGRLYFVMEYLDGVELGELIRDKGLDVDRALRITHQIAEALSAAHEAGIIHRDLKPENIVLVERDGNPDFVKVLDFGIAMTIDPETPQRRLTQPGLAVGTPDYMAPEQALGLTADARSDIYALGAIFYEMVTGAQAYRANTFTQLLVLKATTEPRPPSELRADLPAAVEAVILQAMAREPSDRYQSMAALMEDIAASLEERTGRVVTATRGDSRPTRDIVLPPRAAPAVTSIDPQADTVMATLAPRRSRVGRRLALVALLGGVMAGAYWYQFMRGAPQAAPIPTAAPRAPDPKVVAAGAQRPSTPVRSPTATAEPDPSAEPKQGTAAARRPAPPPKTAKQAKGLLGKARGASARKQWEAASSLYDRVARSRFTPELGHLGLGQVALASGDEAAASRHAKTSVRLGGGLPARRVLAQALARLGQHAAAAEQYRLILRREPRDAASRSGLNRALKAQRTHKRR